MSLGWCIDKFIIDLRGSREVFAQYSMKLGDVSLPRVGSRGRKEFFIRLLEVRIYRVVWGCWVSLLVYWWCGAVGSLYWTIGGVGLLVLSTGLLVVWGSQSIGGLDLQI